MSRPQRRYGAIDDRIRAVAVAKALDLINRAGMSKTGAAKAIADEFAVHFNTILLWLEAHGRRTPSGGSVIDLQAHITRLQEQLTASRAVNQALTEELHLDPERSRP